eukprot:scaffold12202_cov32-Tisochrysis_lutea.AAC.3
MDELWPSKSPLLLAPDSAFDSQWVEAFLHSLLNSSEHKITVRSGPTANRHAHHGLDHTDHLEPEPEHEAGQRGKTSLDMLSYHVYPLGAGDGERMLSKSLDVSMTARRPPPFASPDHLLCYVPLPSILASNTCTS